MQEPLISEIAAWKAYLSIHSHTLWCGAGVENTNKETKMRNMEPSQLLSMALKGGPASPHNFLVSYLSHVEYIHRDLYA